MPTEHVNLLKLKKLIPELYELTTMSLGEFYLILSQKLSSCGIAFVLLPYIPGSYLHGATFYDKNKIVMGLMVRGKDADCFWLSLFNEIADVLYCDIDDPTHKTETDEKEADHFAKNILISEELFDTFVKNNTINKETIQVFADAGIVVGRLQKDGYLKYNELNSLKKKYSMDSYVLCLT